MATKPTSLAGGFGSGVSGLNMRGIALNLLVDAVLPFVAYQVLTGRGLATVPALIISGLFPAAWSVSGLIRARRVDIIGGLVLVGIAVSIVAALIGGNAKVLLIRESFVTGALGIVALASLLAPRPLLFYFARQMTTGMDHTRMVSFDARWEHPWFRHLFRTLTSVWGLGWAGEFTLRVVLVSLLTVPQALVITPILFNLITAALFIWTFAYSRRIRACHLGGPVPPTRINATVSSPSRASMRASTRSPVEDRDIAVAPSRHSVSARRQGARRSSR